MSCEVNELLKQLPVNLARDIRKELTNGKPFLPTLQKTLTAVNQDIQAIRENVTSNFGGEIATRLDNTLKARKPINPSEALKEKLDELWKKVARTRKSREKEKTEGQPDTEERPRAIDVIGDLEAKIQDLHQHGWPGVDELESAINEQRKLLAGRENTAYVNKALAKLASRINTAFYKANASIDDADLRTFLTEMAARYPEGNPELAVIQEVLENLQAHGVQTEKQQELKETLMGSIVDGLRLRAEEGADLTTLKEEALRQSFEYYLQYPVSPHDMFLSGRTNADYLTYLKEQGTELEKERLKKFDPETMPAPDLASIVAARQGDPSSVLARIPNFIDMMAVPELRNLILSGFGFSTKDRKGLADFVDFVDEFKNRLENEIMPVIVAENAQQQVSGSVSKQNGTYTGEKFSQSPYNYLRGRMSGNKAPLPSNVVTALALELASWVGQMGANTMVNTPETVAEILNKQPLEVTEEEINMLRDAGTLRRNVMESLTKRIMRHLHLQPTHHQDGYLADKLGTSLALLALESGIRSGILQEKSVPLEWMMEHSGSKVEKSTSGYEVEGKSEKGPQPSTLFIKVASDPVFDAYGMDTGGVQLSDKAAEVTDMFNNSQDAARKLFDLWEHARPVHDTPTEEVPAGIRGSAHKASDEQRADVARGQQRPVVANVDAMRLLNRFDPDTLKRNFMGYKDLGEIQKNQEESQKGKNQSADRELQVLLEKANEVPADGQNLPKYYFDLDFKKNNRSMITNNDLNVQAAKSHRWFFVNADANGNPTWTDTFGPGDIEGRNRMLATLALALDIKVNGAGIDKALTDADYYDAVEKQLRQSPEIEAAVQLLNDKTVTGQFTPEQAAIIGAAAPEGMHSLAGLEVWARYRQFLKSRKPGRTFSYSLPMEIDGLTNGLAISLLQIPGRLNEHMKTMLRRVGILFQGDGFESFADYRAKSGDLDNYQDLAKRTHSVMDSFMNPVAFRDELKTLNNSLAASKDSREKRLIAIEINQLKERHAVAHAVSLLMPVLVNEEGDVTSGGRKFGKGPLLTSNYGAGGSSIKAEIAQSPVDTFYENLMEIAHDNSLNDTAKAQEFVARLQLMQDAVGPVMDPENPQKVISRGSSIKVPTAEAVLQEAGQLEGGVYEYLRNYTLPSQAEAELKRRTKLTYGTAAMDALQDMLGSQWEIRNSINEAARFMNAVYANRYQERLKEAIKAKDGSPLSQEEELAIKKEMLAEGLVPSVGHASSYGNLEQMVEITNEPMTPVADNEQGKAKIEFQVPRDNKRVSSQNLQRGMPNTEIGVKAFVLMIQSFDSNNITRLFGSHDIFHVFDAFVTGTRNMNETAKEANRLFLEGNRDWSLLDEVENRLEPFKQAMQEIPEKALDEIAAQLYGKDYTSAELPPQEFLQNVLGEFSDTAAAARENRQELFSQIEGVNQFAWHDGVYRPGDQATNQAVLTEEEITRLDAELEKSLGQIEADFSIDFNNDMPGDRPAASPLTAVNARRMYEQAQQLDSVQISKGHARQLDRLMDRVVTPFLSRVDKFKMSFENNPEAIENRGLLDSDNVVRVISAGNQQTSPSAISLRETMVHEYVHVATRDFLDNNVTAANKVRTLREHARKHLEKKYGVDEAWQAFLPRLEAGEVYTDLDRRMARHRYEYVFDNLNGASDHEFMAMGVTNEALAEALMDMDVKQEKPAKIWDSDFIKTLNNLVQAALDWWSLRRIKGKNVHDALVRLAQEASLVEEANENRLLNRWERRYQKAVDTAYNKTIEFIGRRRGVEVSAEYLKKGYQKAFKEFTSEGRMGGTISEFARRLDKDLKGMPGYKESKGVVGDLVREITGLKKEDLKNWRTLHRLVRARVDNPRSRVRDVVAKTVKAAFDPKRKLTERQWKAVNDVFLRGDLVSLVQSVPLAQAGDRLLSFMTDQQALNEEISRIKGELESGFGRNGIFYSNQAKILGALIANAEIPMNAANPMTNAHDIAHLRFLAKEDAKPVGDLEVAENLIDQLASLYALQVTDSGQKLMAANILRNEIARTDGNGVMSLLAYHQNFKNESLDAVFGGNKIGTWKGYTKETYDPDIQIEIAPADRETEKQLALKGFKQVGLLEDDPTVAGRKVNTRKLAIYQSSLGINRYRAGVVSMTNPQKRGTDLIEASLMGQEEQSNRGHWNDIENMIDAVKKANQRKALKQGRSDLDLNSYGHPVVVPVLDQQTGEIINYRYLMSKDQKDELLKRDDQAPDTLGKMFASIPDKIETRNINKQVVDLMQREWEALKGNKDQKWVTLSPHSRDEKAREAWAMLPINMRNEVEKVFGRKALPVRKDMYNYILGFREVSVPASLQKAMNKRGKKLPNAVMRAIIIADDVWKELVQNARLKLSLVVPDVVLGNFVSNFLLLLADGIPLSHIIRASLEGRKALKTYTADRRELDKLDLVIQEKSMRGEDTRREEARKTYLQRQLEKSPVNELVEEGLFQVIVEDVDPEEMRFGKRKYLQKSAEYATRKLGTGGGRILRELSMLPGSQTFSLAIAANQMADFMGRYTKYTYDTKVRKRTKIDAINDSMDAFIYYDEPVPPWMQAGNDYGVLMFTRFLTRIQRVVARIWKNSPIQALLVAMLNRWTIDAEDINDYFLDPGKLMNRIRLDPLQTIGDAIGLPLLDWFKVPFRGVDI